jgi:hypothetical protein
VSDRDVDEFVAAAMSHRRGPQSVEALLAENERLRAEISAAEKVVDANRVSRWRSIETKRAQQLEAELVRLREAVENLVEDVEEVLRLDETLPAEQHRIGGLLLGYGGGHNHLDDLRAALAAGDTGAAPTEEER